MNTEMPLHFFGIGAQKAGTTWLHDVLDGYPDCAVPPVKELHFFDIKYEGGGSPRLIQRYRERLEQMVSMANGFGRDVFAYWDRHDVRLPSAGGEQGVFKDGYLDKLRVEQRIETIINLAQYFKIRDADSYCRYLEDVRTAKGASTVGEFTPSYSFLPEQGYREMDELFPGSRFVFIMRDPVDRLLSQLRFRKKAQLVRGRSSFDPVEYFDTALDEPGFILRSNYRATIETLEKVIPRERILYLFFEDMISTEHVVRTMRAVEGFLQLSPKDIASLKDLVERKKNTAGAVEFSPGQIEKARSVLDDVYRFVEDRFDGLPEGWMNT